MLFNCIRQFTFITVSAAIVNMEVVSAQPRQVIVEVVSTVLLVTVKLSTLVTMFSLFVFVNSSKPLLGHLNTKFKFVSIKCTCLFELLRNAIMPTVFNFVFRGSDHQCMEPEQHQRMFWMWSLTGWSVVLAVLTRKAFPAEEIQPVSPHLDYGADQQHMFLLQAVHGGLPVEETGAAPTSPESVFQ